MPFIRKVRKGGLILFKNRIHRCIDKCLKPFEGEKIQILYDAGGLEIYSNDDKYLGILRIVID